MNTPYSISPPISNRQIVRELERRERRAKLIRALRVAVFLCASEAYDQSGLRLRCLLIRLVQAIDEVLRQLVNQKGGNHE